ncbi:DUF5666 domain-containing protein [Vibrio rotiferianus]|uniref:DUF5666 domain-containing protein n=1 Tax=Vibrio rotiferianus TaxID=190895 RepID=UPI00406A821A
MKKLALVAAMGLALSGCGGSGGSGSSSTQPTAKPSTAIGTVESVNSKNDSITVNGYTYRVSEVMYGGKKTNLASIKPNMMVQVGSGKEKSSSAPVVVTLEPTMTGHIQIIKEATGAFTINGFKLVYPDLNKSDIESGDWVMVSSLPAANDQYKVLSVVKFESNFSEKDEIEGRISSIDINKKEFKLGANVTVAYDRIADLQVGQWVEAEGSFNGNVFDASYVEIENYNQLAGDNDVEGIVTWVNQDQSAFELNYRGTFVINSKTCFQNDDDAPCNPSLISNLAVGAEVEVTSVLGTANTPVATHVEFEKPDWADDNDDDWNVNEFECSGWVTNYKVNGVDQATFDIDHCWNDLNHTIDNSSVIVNGNTLFEDGLSFSNIENKRIEVEGTIINNANVALEVEPWEADD